MTIPNKYQISGDNALANYDYYDIIEGTGTKEFYLFKSVNNGATGYHLSGNTIDSGDRKAAVAGTAVGTPTTYTILGQTGGVPDLILFSGSAFNLPKTIKGTAYVTFTWVTKHSSNAVRQAQAFIYKNSTLLGSALTEPTPNADTEYQYHEILKIPIAATHFKKGDILAVALSGSATGTHYMCHDSLNGNVSISTYQDITAANTPTRAKVYIPFQLDL